MIELVIDHQLGVQRVPELPRHRVHAVQPIQKAFEPMDPGHCSREQQQHPQIPGLQRQIGCKSQHLLPVRLFACNDCRSVLLFSGAYSSVFELGKLRVIFSVLSRRLCFRHCFRPIHSDIEIFQHVLLSPPPGSFQYAMFYDSAYASKTDEFIDFVYMSGTHKRREISTAKVVAE